MIFQMIKYIKNVMLAFYSNQSLMFILKTTMVVKNILF